MSAELDEIILSEEHIFDILKCENRISEFLTGIESRIDFLQVIFDERKTELSLIASNSVPATMFDAGTLLNILDMISRNLGVGLELPFKRNEGYDVIELYRTGRTSLLFLQGRTYACLYIPLVSTETFDLFFTFGVGYFPDKLSKSTVEIQKKLINLGYVGILMIITVFL